MASPSGLQFDLAQTTYNSGSSIGFTNTSVSDEDGVSDLVNIDFWALPIGGGQEDWIDLSDVTEFISDGDDDTDTSFEDSTISLSDLDEGDYYLWARTYDQGGEFSNEVFKSFTVSGEVATAADPVIGTVESDSIQGTADEDLIRGNPGDDTLVGGDGADMLRGGIGNDSIFGNAGDDQLRGNPGDDTLIGGDGADDIRGGVDNDLLYGSAGDDFLQGRNGNDVIFGEVGNDSIEGSQDNDTLYGGLDNDTILGKIGDDILSGDAGDDLLQGGLGVDNFYFENDFDSDTIEDFQNDVDLIWINKDTYTEFNDIEPLLVQVGQSVVINFDDGNGVNISNTSIADLDASDFVFQAFELA